MMNVDELLEACKAARNITTDGELAKALGVSKQAMSSWRHGARLPDPVACATIAGLAGVPLAKVLGVVGEARAISREEKAVWRKLAATAMLLLVAVVPALNPAAAYSDVPTLTAAPHMHYAKSWVGLALGFIRRVFGLDRGHSPAALLA